MQVQRFERVPGIELELQSGLGEGTHLEWSSAVAIKGVRRMTGRNVAMRQILRANSTASRPSQGCRSMNAKTPWTNRGWRLAKPRSGAVRRQDIEACIDSSVPSMISNRAHAAFIAVSAATRAASAAFIAASAAT
jgi:hypothetical protein